MSFTAQWKEEVTGGTPGSEDTPGLGDDPGSGGTSGSDGTVGSGGTSGDGDLIEAPPSSYYPETSDHTHLALWLALAAAAALGIFLLVFITGRKRSAEGDDLQSE